MKDIKKKVLLISPLSPPVGGIASWTKIILDHFNNDSKFNLIHYNSNVKFLFSINKYLSIRLIYGIINSIKQIYQIFHLIKKEKPAIVHINSSASFSLLKDYLLIKISKFSKIYVIIHLHFGRVPNLKNTNNIEWRLLKSVIKNSDTCIVLDKLSKNILNSEGFSNIFVIANPINYDFNKNNKRIKYNNNNTDILFVGHITREKGVFELLEAVRHFTTVDNLILVGPIDSSVKNLLLNTAGSFRDKIIFTGVLNKEEVLIKMKSCTIFVLPSYSEGFPNVILEAMACFCPIISTKVGAIPDMLDNKCGVCIDSKNIYQLTTSLSDLLLNENLRFDLGTNAFNKVKNQYSIDKIGLDIESIWS
jgi:glycosyltransferase involved in cell wall biosynthesis